MISKAKTVRAYLAELPPDRRTAIERVRKEILKRLPRGYEEGMQYGMIGYSVPHSIYPAGYHCDPRQPLPFVCLASQKNYCSLYLWCIYSSDEHEKWFRAEWAKTGKKLDCGKSCIRFKRVEDIPLPLIGRAIARMPVEDFIAYYERAIKHAGARRPAKKKAAVARAATVKKKSPAMRRKKAAAD